MCSDVRQILIMKGIDIEAHRVFIPRGETSEQSCDHSSYGLLIMLEIQKYT